MAQSNVGAKGGGHPVRALGSLGSRPVTAVSFEHGAELWASPAWRRRAVAWLDEQLAAAGTMRTGEVEQPHLRPWSTVLRAPTDRGPVWLKATGPANAFEAGLYELLSRVVPGHVLGPIATDTTRGWVLLPDGGPPLGERLSGGELAEAMGAVLPRYGRLQRELAPHADQLLELGVADMRAQSLPARFDEALAAVGEHVEARGGAEDRAVYRRITGLREAVASWCERLGALPGAPSLDHNDLHPWNVLVDGLGGTRRARFYDWGDAVVAHPFASMLVPLGFVQHRLGADLRDPRFVRIRDAYLKVFDDLGPHADLVEALELACHVGKVARALTWHRALGAEGYDEAAEFADAPLESLSSLLDESYLGGA